MVKVELSKLTTNNTHLNILKQHLEKLLPQSMAKSEKFNILWKIIPYIFSIPREILLDSNSSLITEKSLPKMQVEL